jgi:3D (Asp-Asp-Asp) domain-containing protein
MKMKIVNKKRFSIFVTTSVIATLLAGHTIVSNLQNEPETVPTPTSKVEKVEKEVPQVKKMDIEFVDLGEYTITGYCKCEKCSGRWSVYSEGAGGVDLVEGRHIATSERFPFGTELEIEGLGVYEVQDRVADWIADKYSDRIIDVYFENHDECQNFKEELKVRMVK